MLSSLLRPRKPRRAQDIFPQSSPHGEPSEQANHRQGNVRQDDADVRHAAADWTETENDNDDSEDDQSQGHGHGYHDGDRDEGDHDQHEEHDDEDGDEATPLLPIFSAAHLGTISFPPFGFLIVYIHRRCREFPVLNFFVFAIFRYGGEEIIGLLTSGKSSV